jgi:hypothetical protein
MLSYEALNKFNVWVCEFICINKIQKSCMQLVFIFTFFGVVLQQLATSLRTDGSELINQVLHDERLLYLLEKVVQDDGLQFISSQNTSSVWGVRI